jgi:hypothetical protein
MEKTVDFELLKRLPFKKAYYSDGNTPEADQKEMFKGKHYFQFAFGKAVFNVHEDDDFISKWNEEEIAEVNLDIEESGASLLGFRTYKGMLKKANFEGELDYAKNRFKYQANAEQTVATLEAKATL